jgi:pimeloyl-ACP methyl ester carboxylesterase
MATFVLVHGAWHGGWCWRRVAPLLRTAGHEVFAPTLTGLGERAHLAGPAAGLTTHILDVADLLRYEALSDAVLVGHSYAGLVVTGAASHVSEKVGHVVYLDALVPGDGQCWRDLAPPAVQVSRDALIEQHGGRTLPPPAEATRYLGVSDAEDAAWVRSRLVGQPAVTWIEPLRLVRATTCARTYVLCTDGVPMAAPFAARARTEPGWSYRELRAGHDAMVTAPRELADLLLEVAGRAPTADWNGPRS